MYTLVFVFSFLPFSVTVPNIASEKLCDQAGAKMKQDFAVGKLQPSGGAWSCVKTSR